MNICPVCSDKLLRHWQRGKIAFLCMKCRQEMPHVKSLLNHKNSLEAELFLLKSEQIRKKQKQDTVLTP
ncbi:MAG: hypothetical protein AAF208_06035 [Cyanobacteria bacterium P01_A01_bin.45]